MNRYISLGEVRLGLRLIVKQPILSGTIILALATGICMATMGFTFRDELVNSKLPYQAGDRFFRVLVFNRDGGRLDLDLERYHALRDRATSFEHLGAAGGRPFTVEHGPGQLEQIRGALITASSMAWLDAVPVLGRTLIPEDGESGAERVVVLRESLWRRRYSGDLQLIGRPITIGGQPHTVVGIMPDTFEFPTSGELWIPLDELTLGSDNAFRNRVGRSVPGLRVIGVIRHGVTFDAATVEANALTSSLPTAAPPEDIARLHVLPFTAELGEAETVMSTLVFVLVMVLLVVASNVATLVFARTWSRAPELAVRTALGAARSRVVGQLFFETLLLGSIAAAIGLAGAYTALRYIKGSFEGWPFWITLEPNPRIVAFVVLLTLLVSMVSGLFPALRVTRHDLRNALQSGRGFAFGGFGKAGAFMLVVEVALSVALLNGAVTMARAFNSYIQDVPALPKNQVLTAHLGRIDSTEARDQIVEAAKLLPGVVAAGAGQLLPRLYPPPRPTAVEPIGDETPMAAQPAPSHAVANGYLEAIGARSLSGRLFVASDFIKGAAPVAVVNAPFVDKFLGGRNPIGRRIRIERPRDDGSQEPWHEIVGVVPDLGLAVGDPAMIAGFYFPVRDEFLYYLAVRTTIDPLKLAPQLRAAVAGLDPDLQLEEIRTLEEAGREDRVFLSGVALALTAMGGMALALSIVGIYALLSFMVTRRTREIGIRVALGAMSWQVVRTITGGASMYLLIGGLLGTVLGVLFVQARAVILISIPAPGFWMPLTIFLTLAIAGLTACWLPAHRALRIRPSEALSAD
jgi:putative ABC transport system permease protein